MRQVVLALALGVMIVLGVAFIYYGLEALLASYPDHDRGLWEGVAIATVISSGNELAHRVLRYVDTRKDETSE